MHISPKLTFATGLALIVCCVGLWAQEPAETPAEAPAEPAPPKASAWLKQAREKLATYKSVKADLVEKAAIPDRAGVAAYTFTAKGVYMQGKDLQLHMALSLEFGGHKGSLLEVCDGQIFWTRHDIGDQHQITRRDVREILKAADKAQATPHNVLMVELGLGGLAGFLAACEKEFVFKSVVEETIDDRPVLTLEGRWSKAYLDGFTGQVAKGKPRPPLPAFVPDRIRISLDKETEFPRRIEYLKILPDGKPGRSLLQLDFVKPTFNQALPEDAFVFTPPDANVADVTPLFLQRIEAAKKGAGPGGAPPTGPGGAAIGPPQQGPALPPKAAPRPMPKAGGA